MSMSLDLRSVMSVLENASELELLQQRTAIANLLQNPKRILAFRQRLNTGMPLQYWSLRDRRMHCGRIAQFKPDQVLIHCDDGGHVWVEYAALLIDGHQTAPEPPSRPMLTREAFRLGDTVGFEGRDLLEHIGTTVRLNPKTATIACQEGEWRRHRPDPTLG